MCVTYQTLSELQDQLQDESTIRKIPDYYRDGVSVLKRLLAKKASINEGYAFLIIDLKNTRAGYKLANELTGAIDDLAWRPSEVEQAAKLIDAFVNRGDLLRTASRGISDGTVRLEQALADYERLSEDPVAPKTALAALQGRLANYIKHSQRGSKNLGVTEPDTRDRLENLATTYYDATSVRTVNIFPNFSEFATYLASHREIRSKFNFDAIIENSGVPISIHPGSEQGFIKGDLKIDPAVLVVNANGEYLDLPSVKSGTKAEVRFIGKGATEFATKLVIQQ